MKLTMKLLLTMNMRNKNNALVFSIRTSSVFVFFVLILFLPLLVATSITASTSTSPASPALLRSDFFDNQQQQQQQHLLLQDRLDYAVELWTSRNMSEYSFTWTTTTTIRSAVNGTNNTNGTNHTSRVNVKNGAVVMQEEVIVLDLEAATATTTGSNNNSSNSNSNSNNVFKAHAATAQATTVEELFDRIQKAVNSNMQQQQQQQQQEEETSATSPILGAPPSIRTLLLVEYNDDYGYPTKIQILIPQQQQQQQQQQQDPAVAVVVGVADENDDEDFYVWLSDLTPVRDTPAQQALDQARATWEYGVQEQLGGAGTVGTAGAGGVRNNVYAFSYQRYCECRQYQGPWIIRVENDTITNVETVTTTTTTTTTTTQQQDGTTTSISNTTMIPAFDDKEEQEQDYNYNMLIMFPTIVDLFDDIQEGIHLNAADVWVEYNDKFGYPESIYIDYDADIYDEEFSVDIKYFAPISAVWQPELDKAKQSWEQEQHQQHQQQQGGGTNMGSSTSNSTIQSYTYTYYEVNADATDATDAGPKLIIQVLGGLVVSVNGEQWLSDSTTPTITTMDGLFVRIQEAIDSQAFLVQVSYDQDAGYPQEIYIDYDVRVVGDEWMANVTYHPAAAAGGGETEIIGDEHANSTTMMPSITDPPTTTTTTPPTTTDQELLDAARARWESMGLDNYAFSFLNINDHGLAVPLLFSGNLTVQVHQNKVARVNLVEADDMTDEATALIAATATATAAQIPNLDEVFHRIQMALSDNPFSYSVVYRENGIPIQVNIDPNRRTDLNNDTSASTTTSIRYYISDAWRLPALDDLEGARLLWDSYQIIDYTYSYISYISGSGDDHDADHAGSWIASIDAGKVNLTTLTSTSTSITDPNQDVIDIPAGAGGTGVTIPDLFDLIADMILDGRLTKNNVFDGVEYDETYGYPKRFGSARVEFLTPYTVLRELLSDAMELWQRLEISDYSYVLRIIGFERNVELNRPSLVQVKNNSTVVKVTDLQTGQNVSDDREADARTVGSLFAQVQEAIQDGRSQIVVEYDEDYGYPTEIFIDQAAGGITEEDGFDAFLSELTPVRDTLEQDDLNAAQVLWESQGLEVYAFSYERQCNCSIEDRGPWRVRVQNGYISWTGPSNEFYIPSITDLFGEIQRGMYLNSAEIQVTYNDKLGYPESVYIDYDADVDDEEFSVHVEEFADIGAWQSGLKEGSATWESLDMQSYSFLFEEHTGGGDSGGPKLLEVVDGEVVSVDGKPVQASITRVFVSLPNNPTIDDIFARIQEAVDMGAFTVQVSYDEEKGHPYDIHIDYDDQVFGDEWNAKTTLVEKALDRAPSKTPMKGTLPPTPALADDSAGCARKLAAGCVFWVGLISTML